MRDDWTKRLSRRGFLVAVPGAGLAACGWRSQGGEASRSARTVSSDILPAEPTALFKLEGGACRAQELENGYRLSNSFLELEVSSQSGVATALMNRMTGQRFRLDGDRAGLKFTPAGSQPVDWTASADQVGRLSPRLEQEEDGGVRLILSEEMDAGTVSIDYLLRPGDFWIERRVRLEGVQGVTSFDRLDYGRASSEGCKVEELPLGKFDRPRLLTAGGSGFFAGVGWWFYSVSPDGLYQNLDMDYRADGPFEGEPWYLGVFQGEAGEPYPGWLWYKAFLQRRKREYDSLPVSVCWNAGWGHWGIDIDDPRAPDYLDFVYDLGVRQIGFGGGQRHKPIPEYIDLVGSSEMARQNLEHCKRLGLAVGFLEHGGLGEKWESAAELAYRLDYLDRFARLGFGTYHFDYFKTVDTFTAHRNVTTYFRAVHRRLKYVECHLGMAAYGPQFQREVLLNHPTDLEGFDLSNFSANWTTFLGFRHSRRQWQRRYQYLMPEYSLYYYSTHYSNQDHPRLYEDPEPQQLLYKYETYCGLGYDFHDPFGFRDAMAGASAFSPFFVFGYLDLKMPETDRDFARRFLQWVQSNVEVLRRARVCHEDEESCVVSKLARDRGAIHLLNYGPFPTRFRLTLRLEERSQVKIRRVFPDEGNETQVGDGESFEIVVPGESVVILDVGEALAGLPPGSRRGEEYLRDWRDVGEEWETPYLGLRPGLPLAAADPSLPRQIVSIDQRVPVDPVVEFIGKGRLPDRYREILGFVDESHVESWRLVPWAWPDRVWLVYQPQTPVRWNGPLPTLTLDGEKVPLIPRIDYRPKEMKDWTCPLFFADVTRLLRPGGGTVRLRDDGNRSRGACRLLWISGRVGV